MDPNLTVSTGTLPSRLPHPTWDASVALSPTSGKDKKQSGKGLLFGVSKARFLFLCLDVLSVVSILEGGPTVDKVMPHGLAPGDLGSIRHPSMAMQKSCSLPRTWLHGIHPVGIWGR